MINFFIKKIHVCYWYAKLFRSILRADIFPKKDIKLDILFLLADAHYNIELSNKLYSSIIDSFINKLDLNSFVFAKLLKPFSVVDISKVIGLAYTVNRLYLIFKIKNKLTSFLNIICTRLKVNFKIVSDDFYTSVLLKLQPASVIGIGLPVELCRAARQLNIPVIEILHAYGYSAVPWGYDQKACCDIPSIVLSLDSVSTNTFKSVRNNCFDVLEVPSPWLEGFKNNTFPKKDYSNWFFDKNAFLNFPKRVVLTLQWGYNGEESLYSGIIRNGIISDEIIKAIICTKDSVFWFIRMHPVQRYFPYKKKCLSVLKDIVGVNCEYELATSAPFPVVLSHCTGHITMFSSSAYESAAFCVPSLLLCPTLRLGGRNWGMFKDLLDGGYADFGDIDCDSIIRWVESADQKKNPWSLIQGSGDWEIFVELVKRNRTNRPFFSKNF